MVTKSVVTSDGRGVKKKAAVPAFFDALGMVPPKITDRFTISYQAGMIEIQIIRDSGSTETCVKTVKGKGFSEIEIFNPDGMCSTERDSLIKDIYAKGATQISLAARFGLSQSMISRIISR